MKVECEKITSLLLEFYCWTRNGEELGGIQKINFTIQAHNCRGDFTEIEKVERRIFFPLKLAWEKLAHMLLGLGLTHKIIFWGQKLT